MTDKEILAELKKSWEYLYDILENGSVEHCSGQMSVELCNKLRQSKDIIEDVYYDYFLELSQNDDFIDSIRIKKYEYDDEKIYISNDVSGDYIIKNDKEEVEDYLNCADLEYYWYDDSDFLDR